MLREGVKPLKGHRGFAEGLWCPVWGPMVRLFCAANFSYSGFLLFCCGLFFISCLKVLLKLLSFLKLE